MVNSSLLKKAIAGFAIIFFTMPSAMAASKTARDALKASYPHIKFYQQEKNVTHIYGQAFGSGNSATDAADNFRINYSEIWGINSEDLYPRSLLSDGRHTQQLMYDSDSGRYKFTLVYYSQYLDGIPVFRSDLRILVRNEPGYPVVLASAALKNLGDFEIDRSLIGIKSNAAIQSALAEEPGLTDFTKQTAVIWAGYDSGIKEPRLAVQFEGRSDFPERWLFVADIETGEVLYRENLMIFEDVVGNVSGLATDNFAAEQCDLEVSTPLPYARVFIGSTVTYADSLGDFVIPNGGTTPVTVYSNVRGQWFRAYNDAGSDAQLSQTVTPPGPANFLHNPANTEFTRAEVNGYLHANVVRDYTLKYNPTYPTIYNQTEFPVYVNETTGYCPGNAWYDGYSLTFCQASGNYTNTAFSTIVHHEYGHHLVACAGSGQGQYGEGMGDVMGILITDVPGLAYGFYVDGCDEYMRTGDNTMQYPCSDEIHICGQLISGCVWSTRNELVITEPSNYRDIISSLAINAMLLHTGETITPQITIDYLTLDDDDGNIYNGTPHYNEIDAGFSAHNMPAPELLTGLSVSPLDNYISEGPGGGPFTPSSKIYTLENLSDYGINYEVSTGQTWISLTNASGYLAPSATVQVTVSINSNAESLPDGRYDGSVSFINTTDHTGDTSRDVTLKVGVPQVIYEWTMDTDPGWTTQGLWAYGQPTGGGGAYGYPDPTSSHTGNNVYGYNLYGDYENYLPETHLTSNALDCTGLSDVTLKFWRWLGVETPSYDHAYVRVSNNGVNWTTIWQNGGEIADNAWVLQEYDISAVADNQSTVYLRWTMGTTDVSWTYCGWNLDDIQIEALGGEEPPLYITMPDGAPEYLEPGLATSFNVGISDGAESYVPGTGLLYYRYHGGEFQTASLVPLGGNLYQATLPAADCSANPEFYFSATGDSGSTVYNPPDAPSNVYSATVGIMTELFSDNFETDQGWTVTGTAVDGQWNRGVPIGGGDRGDPPSDYDGSGSCYLTDNVDGNSDVDDGYTYLISPTFDFSTGNVNFSYAVWYTNNNGDNPNSDVFRIWVSNNNGSSWVQVDTIGPVTSAGWNYRSFLVDDYVAPSSQVKVRFEASDLGLGSIVEAGIDAVSATSFVCDSVGYGILSGTVTDGTNPVEGVMVSADDGSQYGGADTTLVDGSYSIDLPVSSYSVTFSHIDYFDSTVTGITIDADQTTTLNMILSELPPGGVAGTVTDSTDPIAGVAVYADDGSGNTASDTTSADGTYAMELPPGLFDISFSHADYRDTTLADIEVINHQVTTLNIAMTELPPGSIAGVVGDGSNPIAGVAVFADNGTGTTGADSTSGDGSYAIELPDGTYDVSFSHDDYYDTTVADVIVTNHNATYLNVTMTELPPGAIDGTVTNYRADPVSDVVVELYEELTLIKTDTTDSNGDYQLSDIDAGSYSIAFSKVGCYDTTLSDVSVLSGETTTANMTIHWPGVYEGFVYDLYDAPVESVYVVAEPVVAVSSQSISGEKAGYDNAVQFSESARQLPISMDWDPVNETYTDQSGGYELILAPGSYEISFSKNGWDTFVTEQVDITLDMVMSDQDVILRSPGALSGLVDYEGTPIENVHVVVEDSLSAPAGEDYTSADGTYLIEGIYDGIYNISFSHSDYVPVSISNYHIMDGPLSTILDQSLVMAGYAYVPGDVNMWIGQWPPSVIGGDVTYLVNYFRGVPSNPACYLGGFWGSADANGDCQVIGSDVTKLVSYFRGISGVQYCPDYPPLWLAPDECPAESPAGWPNCETPPVTGKNGDMIENNR